MESGRYKRIHPSAVSIVWGGSEVLVIEPIVFRDDVTIKVDGGV